MKSSWDDSLSVEQIYELISITKIGFWVWFLQTGKVHYSKEWAEIVGYELSELEPDVETWENMLLPEDLPMANIAVEKHVRGELENYEAEFRMQKKDGTVIWGHDKGRIIEFDEDGAPLVLCGVLQDITRIKMAEDQLRENQEILELTFTVAQFGTWDWDILGDRISYNEEYLKMLGYTQNDINGSLEEWESMIHPDDLAGTNEMLGDYVAGKIPEYECEMRMKHKDGTFVWTRDVGKVVERNSDGKAVRMLGGHLNIDKLKRSKDDLAIALQELETHKVRLEEEIETRTETLVNQDRMLLAVNKISQDLMALDNAEDVDEVVKNCLAELGKAVNSQSVMVWRNVWIDGQLYFYPPHHQDYKFFFSKAEMMAALEGLDLSEITGGMFTNDEKDEFYENGFYDDKPYDHICYETRFPTFLECIKNEKTLNMLSRDLSPVEILIARLQKIKAFIISPIYLNGEPWGFMSIFNTETETLFSEIEENMLVISGSLFANALRKVETDEELRIAHEEALMSSQAKSNFLANMSHEIRTPMNAISGMAEIILRESKRPEITEYATGIRNACGSLLAIINDILDISKIESGKLDIVNAEYSLAELLDDIINLSRMRMESKSLAFFAYIDSTLPAKMIGDESRIKQILVNLMTNAIKFTQSGYVALKVTGHQDKGVIHLTFSVEDTGSGIKKEDMERLFEEFERVNTTKNRSIEGTGLGLAITKRLCEMMDGSIKAESVYGKGSVFTTDIIQKYEEYTPLAFVPKEKTVLIYEPRAEYSEYVKKTIENLGSHCDTCTNQSELYEKIAQNPFDYIFVPSLHLEKVQTVKKKNDLTSRIVEMATGDESCANDKVETMILPVQCMQVAEVFNEAPKSQRESGNAIEFIAPNARVLIVDDSPVNLKVAMGLMRPYEFYIETANDGIEAVEKVKRNRYDMVFMDHMMPGMDGIDATAAIRKMKGEYYQDLPIVALTANAIAGTKELFIQEGMNDFISKPIEISKLNDILVKWLPKEKQETVEKVAPKIEQEEYNLKIKGVDVGYGVRLLGGNFDDYVDIVKTYYADSVRRQVSIATSYSVKDTRMLKTEVHAVKSASTSIGALGLAARALKLEEACQNDDWVYIEKNIARFFEEFADVIEEIPKVIKTEDEGENDDKLQGDIPLLKDKLSELGEAIEFVDISRIEDVLDLLFEYSWEDEIEQLLLKIKGCIETYEYDEAVPLINDISEKLT